MSRVAKVALIVMLTLMLGLTVPGLAYAISTTSQDPWWILWLRDYGLILAINGITVWVSWSSRQYFVSQVEMRGKLDAVDNKLNMFRQQIDELDGRLIHLETATMSIPGRVDKMCERMSTLAGDNKEIKARIDGLDALMKRIDYQLSMMMQGHMREERG